MQIQQGILIFILLLILLTILGIIVSVLIRIIIGTGYTIKKSLINEIITHMEIKDGDNILHIGSMYGSLIFNASNLYKIEATGQEMLPLPTMIARIRRLLRFKGYSLIDLKVASYNDIPVAHYDKIIYTISPRTLHKIEKGVKAKSKSTIFTLNEEFDSIRPNKIIELTDGSKLYRYN